ncbi:MAG: thiamine-phosphate kinase, partial [Pseudomonadota bacterium]
MTRTDEFALIETLFAPLATDAAALGLKDDAALWSAAGEGVIAKDMLVEGVHFRSADPLDRVARKALRVNLSDLAAMGATPAGYLLGLALPDRLLDRDALGPFADGLAEDQAAYGLSLIGGDTTRTPGPLVVSITMTGRLDGRRPLRRGGALVGDDVYVSGTIGDAGLGLRAFEGAPDGLAREHVACLKDRYQLPEPRLGLGEALCGVASAAADVSDGLLSDAG